MELINKMPWYAEYLWMKKQSETNEDIDTPQMHLQRVKDFFDKLNADPTKNTWILEEEKHISTIEASNDFRKKLVDFISVVDSVISDMNQDNVAQLKSYRSDERFASLVSSIMFYVGISTVKNSGMRAKQAYSAIINRYPITNGSLFVHEGVYYYIYFFQNLDELIQTSRGSGQYKATCKLAEDFCRNTWLLISKYSNDDSLGQSVTLVLNEINKTKQFINVELTKIHKSIPGQARAVQIDANGKIIGASTITNTTPVHK